MLKRRPPIKNNPYIYEKNKNEGGKREGIRYEKKGRRSARKKGGKPSQANEHKSRVRFN